MYLWREYLLKYVPQFHFFKYSSDMVKPHNILAFLRISGGQTDDDVLVLRVLLDIDSFEQSLISDPGMDEGYSLENLCHIHVNFQHKLWAKSHGIPLLFRSFLYKSKINLHERVKMS